MAATPRFRLRRPGYRASMCRDTTNPARVVPDPHAWRDRRCDPTPLTSRATLRYARDQLGECSGRSVDGHDRLVLSPGAVVLYIDLCNIALSRGTKGVLDLTYAQLQRARGVPEVHLVDPVGRPLVDELDAPVRVLDPDWGEGIRTLQRQLRELQSAEFVSIGYIANANCGGHRLCVSLGGPDWFLDRIRAIEAQGRAKGGRRSRGAPPIPPRPVRGPVGHARDCPECHGLNVMETTDGTYRQCSRLARIGARAGP